MPTAFFLLAYGFLTFFSLEKSYSFFIESRCYLDRPGPASALEIFIVRETSRLSPSSPSSPIVCPHRRPHRRPHRHRTVTIEKFKLTRYPISIFGFYALVSGEQMRADDADQFAGGDDFGFLSELWEMALIAGDQVIRAGGFGTVEENIIGGVGRDLKQARGRDEMGAVFEELKKLLPKPFANIKFRAR